MDTLRGLFGGHSEPDYSEADGYDPGEDEIGHDTLPPVLGQDERRMQVRAYNHWASLLGNRSFPLISDLDAGNLPDFDPNSVLIDVTGGIENPVVRYLGSALAAESGCDTGVIHTLADVPSRSLASRITDHYLQIIANEAPIGFEAEFTNQRGRTILYRGILLPFSASMASTSVDLIYGVINWKELVDQQTTEELMLAIDQALRAPSPADLAKDNSGAAAPMPVWADGPAELTLGPDDEEPLELTELLVEDDAAGLADLLASAREMARAAQGSEDRTRHALYAAIGRAHDFALAAQERPDEFQELVEDAGLAMQARAPLIPVVKLVFGADYDKTRLTEYATVIGHAQRIGLPRGGLAEFLAGVPGGLKGILQTERELRREASGKPARTPSPREAVAARLRDLPTSPLAALTGEGEEFTLVVARRINGQVVMVGEVAHDVALLDRAARQLLEQHTAA